LHAYDGEIRAYKDNRLDLRRRGQGAAQKGLDSCIVVQRHAVLAGKLTGDERHVVGSRREIPVDPRDRCVEALSPCLLLKLVRVLLGRADGNEHDRDQRNGHQAREPHQKR
jgi:hypothetical protein